jgi:hypothetical protein
MEPKDKQENIYKLENCACICLKAPKRKPTCKVENCEKWSVCNGVLTTVQNEQNVKLKTVTIEKIMVCVEDKVQRNIFLE